jgi:spore coat protein CotF
MKDVNSAVSLLTEQQILQDTLTVQKHVTDAYNTFACECAGEQLRSAMMDILNDEHCIQASIFKDMQSRGWYPVEQADAQKIQQTKTKLSAS